MPPHRRRVRTAAGLATLLATAAPPAGAVSPFDPPLPLETRLYGESRWRASTRASLRIMVRDAARDRPLEADLTLSLLRPGTKFAHTLWQGRTGEHGSASFSFRVPPVEPGPYILEVRVRAALGLDLLEAPIAIVHAVTLTLATDKALYRTGDAVHLRARIRHLPGRRPHAGFPITFAVEDPRGRRIARRRLLTSAAGEVSFDLPLAREALAGTYTARIDGLGGEDEPIERSFVVADGAARSLTVKLETTRTFARPGEALAGTATVLDRNRLPVAGARVQVVATATALTADPLAAGAASTTETSGAGASGATTGATGSVALVLAAAFVAGAFLTGAGSSGCSSRTRPSRSALRRTRSACASSMLDECVFTPMPRSSERSSVSLFVRPSSLASSWTRIFAANVGSPALSWFGALRRCAQLRARLSSLAQPGSRARSRLRDHRGDPTRRHAGRRP